MPEDNAQSGTRITYFIPFIPGEITAHESWRSLTWKEKAFYLTIRLSDRPDKGFRPSRKWIGQVLGVDDLREVTRVISSLVDKGLIIRSVNTAEHGLNKYEYPVPGSPTPLGKVPNPPLGKTPNLIFKESKNIRPPLTPPQSEGVPKPEARGGIASQSDQKESESLTIPDEVYDLLDALGLKRLAARYIKIFPEKMTVDWLSKLQRYIKSESDIRSPRKFAIAAIEDDKWSPEDDMKREPTKPIAMVTSWCQRCKKAYSVTEQHARDGFVCSACFYAPVERKDSEVSAMQEIFAQRRRNSGRPEWKQRTEQTANIIRDFTPGQPRNCDKCEREYLITIDMDFYCAPCRAESQSKHKSEAVHAGNS